MKLGAVHGSLLLGALLCGTNGFAEVTATPTIVPYVKVEPAVSSGGTNTGGGESIQPGEAGPVAMSVPDLLARVREVNDALYTTLQSFICSEQIERFKGSLSGEDAQHIDTVKTKVSFENGIEHYSDILQDKQRRMRISAVAGAWSEGEFGTLLQQTQILLSTQPVLFRAYAELNGAPAAIYGVEISQQNSPWVLEVDRHHYRIPFRTEAWVSRSTGQILRIERVSTAIPSRVGISQMRWGVTLEPVQLDQKNWLLPKTGTYTVLYEAKGKREWNELTFSDYHRYGSEVALRFE